MQASTIQCVMTSGAISQDVHRRASSPCCRVSWAKKHDVVVVCGAVMCCTQPTLGTPRVIVLSGMFGGEVIETVSAYRESGEHVIVTLP